MADENPISQVGSIDWKHWYASKTFWGLVIFAVSFGAKTFLKHDVDPILQSTLATDLADVGQAIGGIVTAWGIRSATTTIGAPK